MLAHKEDILAPEESAFYEHDRALRARPGGAVSENSFR